MASYFDPAIRPTDKKKLAKYETGLATHKKRLASDPTYAAGYKKVKAQRIATRKAKVLDRSPLMDPTAILGGRSLRKGAESIVDLGIKPQLREVDRATVATQRQATDVAGRASGYYQQLAQDAAQHLSTSQALSQSRDTSLQSIANETQDRLQNAQNASQAATQQDINLRGQGLQGNAVQQLASEAQAQKAQAAGAAQNFRTQGVLQGGNYANYSNALAGSTGLRGGEVQTQIGRQFANKLTDLTQKRGDIMADRSNKIADTLTKLRQSEFEKAATIKGLDIKSSDIAATLAKQQSDQNLALKKLGLTKAQLAETGRHNQATEGIGQQNADTAATKAAKTAKGKGAKPIGTPSSRQKRQDQFSRATAIVRNQKGLNKDWSSPRVQDTIAASKNIPSDLVRAAVITVRDGGISQKFRNQLYSKYGTKFPKAKGGRVKAGGQIQL